MHKITLCTSLWCQCQQLTHNNHVQCLVRQLRTLVTDQLVMTTWEIPCSIPVRTDTPDQGNFSLASITSSCLRSGEAFDCCPVNNFLYLLSYLFCRSHYLDIHQGLPAAQVNCLVVLLVHPLKEAVKYFTTNILSNLYHPDPHLN